MERRFERRFTDLERRFTGLERRFTGLEGRFDGLINTQLPQALSLLESRSMLRRQNRNSSGSISMLPLFNNPVAPVGPNTIQEFWAMNGNQANTLLEFYGLARSGNLSVKRLRLSKYLDVPTDQ